MPAIEPLPLSLINDFLYCPRRAAMKIGEAIREANRHTARGDIVHEHVDLPGFEVAKDVLLIRALPVFSHRLGLNGRCDIVERHPDGTLRPVEFKLGKRRQWENDDAQLCAQALCLEEMTGAPVARGAVFHADSKRRREVEFSLELRQKTESAVRAIHTLAREAGEDAKLPLARFEPSCQECSLFDRCLPAVTCNPEAVRRASMQLYKT